MFSTTDPIFQKNLDSLDTMFKRLTENIDQFGNPIPQHKYGKSIYKTKKLKKEEKDLPNFFKKLDQDFIGIKKLENDNYLYHGNDVMVRTNWELPIVLQWPNSKIKFSFSTSFGEIYFGIVFVPALEEGQSHRELSIETLEPMKRYPSNSQEISGSFDVPCEGVLFFMWDNSFDWLGVKQLLYTVEVFEPSFDIIDEDRISKISPLLSELSHDLEYSSSLHADLKNSLFHSNNHSSMYDEEIQSINQEIQSKEQQERDLMQRIHRLEREDVIEKGLVPGLCIRLLDQRLLSLVLSYLLPFPTTFLSSSSPSPSSPSLSFPSSSSSSSSTSTSSTFPKERNNNSSNNGSLFVICKHWFSICDAIMRRREKVMRIRGSLPYPYHSLPRHSSSSSASPSTSSSSLSVSLSSSSSSRWNWGEDWDVFGGEIDENILLSSSPSSSSLPLPPLPPSPNSMLMSSTSPPSPSSMISSSSSSSSLLTSTTLSKPLRKKLIHQLKQQFEQTQFIQKQLQEQKEKEMKEKQVFYSECSQKIDLYREKIHQYFQSKYQQEKKYLKQNKDLLQLQQQNQHQHPRRQSLSPSFVIPSHKKELMKILLKDRADFSDPFLYDLFSVGLEGWVGWDETPVGMNLFEEVGEEMKGGIQGKEKEKGGGGVGGGVAVGKYGLLIKYLHHQHKQHQKQQHNNNNNNNNIIKVTTQLKQNDDNNLEDGDGNQLPLSSPPLLLPSKETASKKSQNNNDLNSQMKKDEKKRTETKEKEKEKEKDRGLLSFELRDAVDNLRRAIEAERERERERQKEIDKYRSSSSPHHHTNQREKRKSLRPSITSLSPLSPISSLPPLPPPPPPPPIENEERINENEENQIEMIGEGVGDGEGGREGEREGDMLGVVLREGVVGGGEVGGGEVRGDVSRNKPPPSPSPHPHLHSHPSHPHQQLPILSLYVSSSLPLSYLISQTLNMHPSYSFLYFFPRSTSSSSSSASSSSPLLSSDDEILQQIGLALLSSFNTLSIYEEEKKEWTKKYKKLERENDEKLLFSSQNNNNSEIDQIKIGNKKENKEEVEEGKNEEEEKERNRMRREEMRVARSQLQKLNFMLRIKHDKVSEVFSRLGLKQEECEKFRMLRNELIRKLLKEIEREKEKHNNNNKKNNIQRKQQQIENKKGDEFDEQGKEMREKMIVEEEERNNLDLSSPSSLHSSHLPPPPSPSSSSKLKRRSQSSSSSSSSSSYFSSSFTSPPLIEAEKHIQILDLRFRKYLFTTLYRPSSSSSINQLKQKKLLLLKQQQKQEKQKQQKVKEQKQQKQQTHLESISKEHEQVRPENAPHSNKQKQETITNLHSSIPSPFQPLSQPPPPSPLLSTLLLTTKQQEQEQQQSEKLKDQKQQQQKERDNNKNDNHHNNLKNNSQSSSRSSFPSSSSLSSHSSTTSSSHSNSTSSSMTNKKREKEIEKENDHKRKDKEVIVRVRTRGGGGGGGGVHVSPGFPIRTNALPSFSTYAGNLTTASTYPQPEPEDPTHLGGESEQFEENQGKLNRISSPQRGVGASSLNQLRLATFSSPKSIPSSQLHA